MWFDCYSDLPAITALGHPDRKTETQQINYLNNNIRLSSSCSVVFPKKIQEFFRENFDITKTLSRRRQEVSHAKKQKTKTKTNKPESTRIYIKKGKKSINTQGRK